MSGKPDDLKQLSCPKYIRLELSVGITSFEGRSLWARVGDVAPYRYFIYIGMVDVNLQAKPAMKAWDELFIAPLKAGN